MKTNVNEYDFRRAFEKVRPDNFSYKGLGSLYDYMVEFEEDTGAEVELDVIAFCGEFTEYENIQEFNDDYGEDLEDINDISELTSVIDIDGESFIIQDY